MENYREYGPPPFALAVVHGGPGAGGEMAPVARELANDWGVLEPIQTANSLNGQVEELRNVLRAKAQTPIILIGYSWGAWLGYILTARHPELVKKLILVSSGPLKAEYVTELLHTRLNRLSVDENLEFNTIIRALGESTTEDKDGLLARLSELVSKTDSYDKTLEKTKNADSIGPRGDVFQNVWAEAAEMRSNGCLLELGELIQCPVTAIHGDYDPHPAAGVQIPLSGILPEFQFHLLEKCGHTPWLERHARTKFYKCLRSEITQTL